MNFTVKLYAIFSPEETLHSISEQKNVFSLQMVLE